jgi:hypothetical protein
MNAVLVIIADGGQAIVVMFRGSRNKLISHLLYSFILIPLMAASSNPFQRGSQGWGVFIHQRHGGGGGNGSIMVGMFVCLCLACIKPSEQEFFVPTGTELAVKLLTFKRGKKTLLKVSQELRLGSSHRHMMENRAFGGKPFSQPWHTTMCVCAMDGYFGIEAPW